MKSIVFVKLLLSLLLFVACTPQAVFKLTGELQGPKEQSFLLKKWGKKGFEILDTVYLVNGKIDYTGKLDQPVLLTLESDRHNRVSFFGDNASYTIEGKADSLGSTTISGGVLQDEYVEVSRFKSERQNILRVLGDEIRAAVKTGDTINQSLISVKWERTVKELEAYQLTYIEDHPQSPVAAYIAKGLLYSKPLDEMKAGLELLDPSLASSVYYQSLVERIEVLEQTAIGKVAPYFTLNDINGNSVSLASFRGKYLLIDFWASWCGPCRRENPNVVKLYNDYKDKGFEILSVSLDKNRDMWLKAINDDGLTWSHVSDLKGWDSDVAMQYGVTGIPHIILINREGVIVAKNLRGEQLRKKLEEVLN